MNRMRKGESLSMFARHLESALARKEVLGCKWRMTDLDKSFTCDWIISFKAGVKAKAVVTFGKYLWLSMWVAGDGDEEGKFNFYPKSLKLYWLRTAKETAHHVSAVIGLVADAIEKSIGYDKEEAK